MHTRVRVDVRPWPHEPSIAHLILLDVNMVPSHDDIVTWMADTFRRSLEINTIRTGALFPNAAAAFAEHDFRVVDRLVLLERVLSATEQVPRPPRLDRDLSVRRLRQSDLDAAADIDAAAFPVSWRNDARSLDDIVNATPSARARLATANRQPIGFAITGKAGPTGYLQRFAVADTAQRRGIARHLVDDAVRWLSRRGATNALVNTGLDNTAALTLYERCGFVGRDEDLVVMERHR